LRAIKKLIVGLTCCLQGIAFANTTEIFVRLNSSPFSAPYYIFSNTENGDAITPELVKGSTYVFTRTDSGHPFNIGSAWKQADSSLSTSSTGTGGAVSGVASIESGQKLTVQIPSDFSGGSITYYCYTHSDMIGTIDVISNAVDSDGDGYYDTQVTLKVDQVSSAGGASMLRVNFDTSVGNGNMSFDFEYNDLLGEWEYVKNTSASVKWLDYDLPSIAASNQITLLLNSYDHVKDVYDAIVLMVGYFYKHDYKLVVSRDAFPSDSTETIDTDSDGIGNNADTDDDGDGYSDEQEGLDGTDPLNRFSCAVGCFSFDIDQSSSMGALTDGLLVLRHLFSFSGDALVSNAVDSAATRTTASEITSYLTDAQSELAIDGDGQVGALTDGLLLLRHLFSFSGDALITGAVGTDATRTTAAEIQAYIEERLP